MCALCGIVVELREKPGRRDLCPHCGRDLRSCVNCRFYAPGLHWDCAETAEQLVKEKDRANFCDSFAYAAKAGGAKPAGGGKDPQADFDKLFG